MRELVEYLWLFTSYNNAGHAVLASEALLPGPAHTLTLASLERAAGGTTCDRVTVREWRYAADASTGALQLDVRIVREFGARERGGEPSPASSVRRSGAAALSRRRPAKDDDSRDAYAKWIAINAITLGSSKPLNNPTRSVGAHTSSSQADTTMTSTRAFVGVPENSHQRPEQGPRHDAGQPGHQRAAYRDGVERTFGCRRPIAANASRAKNA